jgi:hypothetical protein
VELLAKASEQGLLFWIGVIALIAGVVVAITGRLLVGLVLVILGFLLAFGGIGLQLGN